MSNRTAQMFALAVFCIAGVGAGRCVSGRLPITREPVGRPVQLEQQRRAGNDRCSQLCQYGVERCTGGYHKYCQCLAHDRRALFQQLGGAFFIRLILEPTRSRSRENLNVNIDQSASTTTTLRDGSLVFAGSYANINVGRGVSASGSGIADLTGLASVTGNSAVNPGWNLHCRFRQRNIDAFPLEHFSQRS